MKGIILVGCPGAGKGTIGQYLQDEYQFTHLSSGDILRDEVKNKTEIGRRITNIIRAGGRVEDDLITKLVLLRLNQLVECNVSFVLDGFPQTSQQLSSLRSFRKSLGYIYVVVDKNNALERMSNRLSCATCHAVYSKTFFPKHEKPACTKCIQPLVFRESDQCDLARRRIDLFFETTEKVVQNDFENLYRIDGNQPIDEIKNQVASLLEQMPEI